MLRTSIKLFFLLLFISPQVRANDVLERYITVRFQQTSLKEALAEVAQKGGFQWSYNANIIDGGKKISLVTNKWTVRETLYEILGEGYDFKSNGNYLILKKRKSQSNEIYGFIKDPKTGERIANATVYDRKTLRATTTDESGYYALKVKSATEIAVTRLNYQDTVFSITAESPRLQQIALQYDSTPVRTPFNLEKTVDIATSKASEFFKASLEKWNAVNVPDSLHRVFQFSVLPKIGSNHNLSGKVVNDWSINLLAGSFCGTRILEVAGIGNFTRQEMSGVQMAGMFNEMRGNADGAQVAGLYNRVSDTLSGIQLAGGTNYARVLMGTNIQIAGAVNHARNGVSVCQIAGAVNNAKQIEGVQVAGAVNNSQKVNGIQMAGAVNRAKEVNGFQIAGAVNIARKVNGVQIGLFNSAKELDGFQIGLINRSGRRVLPFFNW